jgi:hypothetical protein
MWPLLLNVAAALITVPWPSPSKTSLNLTMGYGEVTSTRTLFVWYAATLDDLSRYSQALPSSGCAARATTTSTAHAEGCTVASNSGYFQFTPHPTYCTGNLVVGGSIAVWSSDSLAMVSVTKNATLLGSIAKEDLSSLGVVHAVSGSGLIQQNGRPSAEGIAQASAHEAALRAAGSGGAEQIAPRTLLGVDARGAFVLIAIDGVEALNLGVTMAEAAEIVSGGARGFSFVTQHAINLDGGGSTTLSAVPGLLKGGSAALYNRPTDTDVGPISEREVTSIVCIK